MGSLFEGNPQQATSYTTSSTDTPKWLQDAIYNQIQLATNVANTSYQPYQLPTVAELSPLQKQAYGNVVANQGAWQPTMSNAMSGIQNLSSQQTAGGLASAQNQYLNPYLSGQALGAGQGYYGGAGQLNTLNAAQPYLNQATSLNAVNAAQPYLSSAGNINAVNAANPYITEATSLNTLGSAQPYLSQASLATGQGLSGSSLAAAQPYLNQAGQSSVANIGQYMNPYQQNVMDTMATQAARNLKEQLLPAISDQFIKAGQFGGTRMGEFGSRALRDTQQALLQEQGNLASQGYQQGLAAAQSDLARQAGLAGTAGQLSSSDLARAITAGGQYANLGQTAGQLTQAQQAALQAAGATTGQLSSQQMQNLANLGQTSGQLTQAQQNALAAIGQTAGSLTNEQIQNLISLGGAQTAAGQAQQQFGLNAATALQGAQAADLSRQQGALTTLADMSKQAQGMTTADTAALEAAGAAQQANMQQQLDAAYQQYMAQVQYPKTQLDWLNTQIRGMAPNVATSQSTSNASTGQTYSASPLSQLAAGYSLYKGLTAK